MAATLTVYEKCYKFRHIPPGPVEAGVVGKEFETIEEKHGFVNNKNVLSAARKKKSPLHCCFEWDDNVASEKYRLVQAGQLIRSLKVVQQEEENVDEPVLGVRAYVSVEEEDDTHYVSIVKVMQTPDLKEQYLKKAHKEMVDWRKRYGDLKEFSKIFEAIDEFEV